MGYKLNALTGKLDRVGGGMFKASGLNAVGNGQVQTYFSSDESGGYVRDYGGWTWFGRATGGQVLQWDGNTIQAAVKLVHGPASYFSGFPGYGLILQQPGVSDSIFLKDYAGLDLIEIEPDGNQIFGFTSASQRIEFTGRSLQNQLSYIEHGIDDALRIGVGLGSGKFLSIGSNTGAAYHIFYNTRFASMVAGVFGGGCVDASAILQAISTTKGFLPPVMTGAQAEDIVSPALWLTVGTDSAGAGDITGPGLWTYNGTNWVKFSP